MKHLLLILTASIVGLSAHADTFMRFGCENVRGETIIVEQRFASPMSKGEYAEEFSWETGKNIPAVMKRYDAKVSEIEDLEKRQEAINKLADSEPKVDPVFGKINFQFGDIAFIPEGINEWKFTVAIERLPKHAAIFDNKTKIAIEGFACEPMQFIEVTVPSQAQQPDLQSWDIQRGVGTNI